MYKPKEEDKLAPEFARRSPARLTAGTTTAPPGSVSLYLSPQGARSPNPKSPGAGGSTWMLRPDSGSPRLGKGRNLKGTPEQSKVRGLIRKDGNTSIALPHFLDYISVVMQCLYASKILVLAYMNTRNSRWVETPFNRRLRDFFSTYREDFGAFDPVPYVEEALLFKERNFEYLKEHDPIEALERIFNALIFSQAKVVRDNNGLREDEPVLSSQTFFGKYITAKICTQCTTS